MTIRRIQLIKPGTFFAEMGIGPPLGILSLAAVLRERYRSDIELDIVQQVVDGLDFDQLERRIQLFKPDLVGFSVLSAEARDLHRAAQIARRTAPDAVIVVGGPHASVFYDKVLEDKNIDFVVIGEGEETLVELIDRLNRGGSTEDLLGLACRDEDGKPVFTGPRPPIQDLDSLPMLAWDLIDLGAYRKWFSMNLFNKRFPYAYVFSTRGCPYRCVYCHNIFGKKLRRRSPERVVDEIEYLAVSQGVKELLIVDDCFNLDLNHAKKVCDLIVERGIDVSIAFPNGLRADIMDRELIRKLKAAGCYTITYAVETATPRLQKLIRKNLDIQKTSEVIRWTDEEGIIVQAFFMLGFQGETPEEMEQTIRFALDHPILKAWFFTVVVYPRMALTDLAREAYPQLDINWDQGSYFYFDEITFYQQATGVDLWKLARKAAIRFYSRPKTMAAILTRFPKNRTLARSFYWGARTVAKTAVRDLKDRLPTSKKAS